MSIKVEYVSKIYGDQKALDSISFETGKQRIVGFLGPNGAGKSTTMKILAGLLPPTTGSCYIHDVSVQHDPLKAKKTIGFLPENNPLYLDMYVREILSFGANTHRIKNKSRHIDDVIIQTGLLTEQHKKLHQLSKGYRQRVGLAMCILHDPAVLILNEPTTGLDPNQILEIRALIKMLGKEKTVLLSTHIMQEVEAICDEVIILNQGKIQDHFSLDDMSQRYPKLSLEEIFVRLTK
ncbi:ATP-binding cassette domain-containing protein [Sphingobacterium suaedae]|uniref:ATP-binding cassette domain-containing protein n=1 Tax=Sphingobacterium suaedae TaxID=1686402 RepID=A0ABW5KDH0_9SPHI